MVSEAHNLLGKVVDGTSGYYPSVYRPEKVTPLDSTTETRQWFVNHEGELSRAGSRGHVIQSLADSFSKAFGVARIHAVQFSDRHPSTKDSDERFLSIKATGTDPQIYEDYAVAMLLFVDMINHPPVWADPDALFTLRTFGCRELAIFLNMARVDLGGDVRLTKPLWVKALQTIRTLNLDEGRRETWEGLTLTKGLLCREESRMASGGIPDAPLFAFDQDRYDCRPRPRPSGPPISNLLSTVWMSFSPSSAPDENEEDVKRAIPDWGILKFKQALQSDSVAAPQCGILIRGRRRGEVGQCPVPMSLDLEQAMTPAYEPQSTRFAQVSLTRASHRDSGGGGVELCLIFASWVHAAIAWHMAPAWVPLLEMENPEAICTSDIDGDRHLSCKVGSTATSWTGTPAPWEFHGAFGNPDQRKLFPPGSFRNSSFRTRRQREGHSPVEWSHRLPGGPPSNLLKVYILLPV